MTKPASSSYRILWLLLVCAFAVGVTVLLLSYIATGPWNLVPDIGDDGAKNTFTLLYHSMYGKGLWFDGMNYPYGDHILYTDEPLLSVILSTFKHITPGTALAAQWILISLSYAIAVVVIYLIFLRFHVRRLLAMVFAGLITVFTPQLLRIEGHNGLSFACVIPLLFYWTLKYHERPAFRYCVYVYLLGITMSFMHPYYGAIMLVWAGLYSLGYFIFIKGSVSRKVRHVLPLLVSVVLVFATIAAVVKVTDPIKDRPKTPYTTVYWNTRPRQLILSHLSPVSLMAKEKGILGVIPPKDEGYMYTGIVVGLAIAVSFFLAFRARYIRKTSKKLCNEAVFPPIWLFMAFASLLFAMGVPFIWKMQWLYEYLSFFKQFRSLGRFSWIFYYIITIYTVVMVDTAFSRLVARNKMVAAYAVVIFAIALWSYEASGYIKYSRNLANAGRYNYEMMFSSKEQNWQSFLSEHHYTRDSFQAILALPYFHVGTEKLWVGAAGWIGTLSAKAGLQLELPMIDAYLARSSWSQAKDQVKIVAGPYVKKPILDKIKSRKPFLLIHFTEEPLDADQHYLLWASTLIGSFSQCDVYACYPDRIAADDKLHADNIRDIIATLPKGRDTCIDDTNTGPWYVDHFSDRTASKLFGDGAMPEANDGAILADIKTPMQYDTQMYEFSCWFLLDDKDYATPNVLLQLTHTDGKMDTIAVKAMQSVDSRGMWFRSSRYFKMDNTCTSVRCILQSEKKHSYHFADELLLRPSVSLIISKDRTGQVMVNNHYFTAP